MNFDTEFTKEDPVLTPEDPEPDESYMNQDQKTQEELLFEGFSFVNKDFNPARFEVQ